MEIPSKSSTETHQLKVGDKVRYQPDYYGEEFDNGIVKSIPTSILDSVFVVYHCDNEWENYEYYTAALTRLEDLKKGWK